MKQLSSSCAYGAVLFLYSSQVLAFDLGFVRAPDWMDKYLLVLLIIYGVFWTTLLFVKPRGIPVRELYGVNKSFITKFCLFVSASAFILFMIMLFIGMGLARM